MLIFQIKYLFFFLATRQLNVGMTASSNMPGRSQPSRIPRLKTYSGSGTDSKYGIDSRSGTASGARTSSKISRAVSSPNISIPNFSLKSTKKKVKEC